MCGIIGISNCDNVSRGLYSGLNRLQHRGQDYAGITTYTGDTFKHVADGGLVKDIFGKDELAQLAGRNGIGHVRYPTFKRNDSNGHDAEEPSKCAQPVYVVDPFFIAMAHNGQVVNTGRLRNKILTEYPAFNPHSDVDYILREFQSRLRAAGSTENSAIFDAVGGLMEEVKGAYSVVALVGVPKGVKVVAFADPQKVRPLVYGASNGSHIFASETCVFDSLGFDFIGDVNGGEVIIADGENVFSERVAHDSPRNCFFEHAYFARPESVIDGRVVYDVRKLLGERLAEKDNIRDGVVVPVPDSGRGAACGYRRRSNRDIDEGLIKLLRLRYFIASPERRVNIIKEKYGFVRSVFDGKQIILVDDSYVRGETSKEVVDTCRKYGAAGVDLRPSVLIRRPCVLGIDITRKGDLMAPRILKDDEQMSDEELFRRIAERTGADSFRSNTVADIEDIAGPNACTGCMGGTYAYQEEVEKLLQLNISDEIRPYEAQS